MSSARSPYPTLYEVLTDVRKGSNWRESVVDGLLPVKFTHREGVLTLTHEQLLSIRVPVQRVSPGAIHGYQRHLQTFKARRAAEWIAANPDYMRTLAVVEVSIDGNGNAFYTDGQHRAAGAVIQRKPLRILVTKRSEAEARKLFANQFLALKPSRNVLIFDGDGVYEEYVQDAVTDEAHPWNRLITTAQQGTSKTRMSATAAMNILVIFVGRSAVPRPTAEAIARFDKTAADQLAVLISAFGTRQTNPVAYAAKSLRSIALTARAIFRDREPHPNDQDRWVTHMTKFNFGPYAYLPAADLTMKLKAHWNSGLRDDDRRVTL